jgi:hypothetical protein
LSTPGFESNHVKIASTLSSLLGDPKTTWITGKKLDLTLKE